MGMTTKLEQVFMAMSALPAERQDELADLLEGVALPTIDYSSDAMEASIDEGLAQAQSGTFSSPADIEAVFSKYR